MLGVFSKSTKYIICNILMLEFDGLLLSNGPGDPEVCSETVQNLKRFLNSPSKKPIFGICLGHQLLGRAIGAETFKMK